MRASVMTIRLKCYLAAGLWLLLGATAWAVRAPDGPYAPLPDYDIRLGYRGLLRPDDARIADEHMRLREQRAARRVEAGEEEATVLSLAGDDGPLTAEQPGLEPQAAARQFLRAHAERLGLDAGVVDGLRAVDTLGARGEDREVMFVQTLGGVPVFQADLKVSLTRNNAVEQLTGNLFPALRVAPDWKLSAPEAVQRAAGYVGPLLGKPGGSSSARSQGEQPAVDRDGWSTMRVDSADLAEYTPVVLTTEPGPEQSTALSSGPFRQDVRARRIIFPLTASEGRPAWRVHLMKAPTEVYQLIVDAEDGVLLNRTNQVKFSTPQGLVFLTHPDDGAQTLRSFVGVRKASPKTFVNSTQSGLQGNNVVLGIGANDTAGPRHFQFSFTNDYLLGGGPAGLNNFNLNGRTLRFTPNSSNGYDLTLPAFADAPGGDNLFLSDDSAACGPAPAGFRAFGASVSQGCVNSNGNVTVSVADLNFAENQIDLALGPVRVMGLWDDLNPSTGGFVGVSFTGSGTSPSKLCFRWNLVPEFFATGSNSFSICLFGTGNPEGLAVGTIQVTYASVSALDGMVGISPGVGTVKGAGTIARSAGFSSFAGATSTTGVQGLARVFPDHNDFAAAATNVFWTMNEIGHDRQYTAGFTKKLRNMQQTDPVLAASGFVDSGDFFDNAFFATNTDGQCCPFSAFGLFTDDFFRNTDSAFDTDVVVHEYGHGVSTRIAGTLDNFQSGAMGEGWSDWFALDYSGDPVMGEYVTGNNNTGIREVAYDASSPRHFGDFGNLLGPFAFNQGTVFFPEVHFDGEIWATMLADLRRALLDAAITQANVSKLIIEGLKNTPANASMLQARDGLISGQKKVKSVSVCTMWQVFAANGFGLNAAMNEAPDTNLPGDAVSIFQSFDRPSTCGGSFVAGATIHSAAFDAANVGDTSAEGWTGTGLWHVSDNRFSSGTRSFYFGDEVLQTYNTFDTEFGSLTSPALNLSAVARPVLELSLFVDTEEFPPFDILWLRVSTNGGVSYPIQRSIFFWDTNAAFRTVRIDLEPLAGQANARIQLYFDTLDDGFNAFEGVYVDSVVVRNYTQN